MTAVLMVIGGVYGLSMVVLLGGGVAWAISRRFREEITGRRRPH